MTGASRLLASGALALLVCAVGVGAQSGGNAISESQIEFHTDTGASPTVWTTPHAGTGTAAGPYMKFRFKFSRAMAVDEEVHCKLPAYSGSDVANLKAQLVAAAAQGGQEASVKTHTGSENTWTEATKTLKFTLGATYAKDTNFQVTVKPAAAINLPAAGAGANAPGYTCAVKTGAITSVAVRMTQTPAITPGGIIAGGGTMAGTTLSFGTTVPSVATSVTLKLTHSGLPIDAGAIAEVKLTGFAGADKSDLQLVSVASDNVPAANLRPVVAGAFNNAQSSWVLTTKLLKLTTNQNVKAAAELSATVPATAGITLPSTLTSNNAGLTLQLKSNPHFILSGGLAAGAAVGSSGLSNPALVANNALSSVTLAFANFAADALAGAVGGSSRASMTLTFTPAADIASGDIVEAHLPGFQAASRVLTAGDVTASPAVKISGAGSSWDNSNKRLSLKATALIGNAAGAYAAVIATALQDMVLPATQAANQLELRVMDTTGTIAKTAPATAFGTQITAGGTFEGLQDGTNTYVEYAAPFASNTNAKIVIGLKYDKVLDQNGACPRASASASASASAAHPNTAPCPAPVTPPCPLRSLAEDSAPQHSR